jgi:hypothetical protein
LAVFMEAIEQAQSMDRHSVRERAAEEFDRERIVGHVIEALRKWAVPTKPENTSASVK